MTPQGTTGVGPNPPVTWWDQFEQVGSVGGILPWLMAKNPSRVALFVEPAQRPRRGGGTKWVPVTVGQLFKDVGFTTEVLRHSQVQPGDHVLVYSRTRYEWLVVDLAAAAVGAVTVGVHDAAHAEHVRWVLRDTAPQVAFVETDDQAHLVHSLAQEAGSTRVLWRFEEHSGAPGQGPTRAEYSRYVDVRAGSHAADIPHSPVAGSDVATIMYSDSGDTRPRGSALTHANLLAAMVATARALSPVSVNPDESIMVYTSLSGIASRLAALRAILCGVPLLLSNPAQINRDLEEAGPSVLVTPPAFLHRIHHAARARAYAAGKQRPFDAAEAAAVRHSERMTEFSYGRPLRRGLLDGPVLSRVRSALGVNLRWALVTGAGCDLHMAHFYRGIGVSLLEGYGPAEVCGAATQNRPGRERFGTVGPTVPGVEVFLGDGGGISVRGPVVFSGHVDEPTTLRRSVDAGGWFTTPDVGEFDDDYLVITGHSGELIVTAGGACVDPVPLEEHIAAHPLIAHAVVVGQGKASLGVLITLDQDAVSAWRTEHNLDELPLYEMATDYEVVSEVRSMVESVNENVTIGSHIRRIKVLDSVFSYDRGQLTAALRIRRDVILRDYAADIDELYSGLPERARRHT